MEWWQWLMILMFSAQLVLCVLKYLSVSGLAQIIKSQKQLNESMQTLSDQMADMEEQFVETKADIRKVSQHFVNFAKGMRQSQGKQWYDGM
jgi:septal ring factor EnvC (AmiA/AmiB activator)